MSLRVAHISTSAQGGGASKAAQRIVRHQKTFSEMIDASYYVGINDSDSNDLIRIKTHSEYLIQMKSKAVQGLVRLITNADEYCSINIVGSINADWCNSLKEDIIHLHWIGGELISIGELRKIAKPIIWTLHDCWPICGITHYPKLPYDKQMLDGYRHAHTLVDRISRWNWKRKQSGYRQNISFHCTTEWMSNICSMSSLSKHLARRVIPYPLDLDIFCQHDQMTSRKLFSIPLSKTVLLFGAVGGTADKRKGADLLIKALEDMPKYLKDKIALVIFGGRERSYLSDFYGFECINVGRIGSESRLSRLYSAADLTIVPSRIEAFGQVITESMACGTPVIGFNTSGVGCLIKSGVNGWLVDKVSHVSLRQTIEYVVSNQVIDLSFRNAVQDWARDFLNPYHIAQDFEMFYLDAINRYSFN